MPLSKRTNTNTAAKCTVFGHLKEGTNVRQGPTLRDIRFRIALMMSALCSLLFHTGLKGTIISSARAKEEGGAIF